MPHWVKRADEGAKRASGMREGQLGCQAREDAPLGRGRLLAVLGLGWVVVPGIIEPNLVK